jgi:hypothetical protein
MTEPPEILLKYVSLLKTYRAIEIYNVEILRSSTWKCRIATWNNTKNVTLLQNSLQSDGALKKLKECWQMPLKILNLNHFQKL